MSTLISIRLTKDQTDLETEKFILELSQLAIVNKVEKKPIDIDWDTISVIVEAVSTLAKIAELVISLRNSKKDEEKNTGITFRRPEKGELEIDNSTDEEIKKWFKNE